MHSAIKLPEHEADTADHAALRLMLSYVEAECLRIGAADAARHAALAAAMVPVNVAPLLDLPPGPFGRHLH